MDLIEDDNSESSASSIDFQDLTDWIVEQVIDANTNKHVKLIYRYRKYIAQGSFGSVSRILTFQRQRLALKEINHSKAKLLEVKIMTQLNHENLISIAYHCNKKMGGNRYRTYIFMEYMPKTVHALINETADTNGKLDEVTCAIIVYQILRGLAYMHRRDIAHRDIKPRNVLLHAGKMKVKLCDFGAAQKITDAAERITYVCSRWYRAPELLLRNKNYDCKVDLWSVGCVLGEMLLLRPLFVGSDTVDQLAAIRDVIGAPTEEELIAMQPTCQYNLYPKPKRRHVCSAFDATVAQSILDLLDSLLQYDSAKRPSPWTALAEPVFDTLRTKDNVTTYPHLFNFTQEELEYNPDINKKLVIVK
ncbi:mitogen-activated protein kinase HOG1-like [Varroa jacobsoni]|uniref:Protein kinase domain-containing protein n=1 Tax=Varroa destructor TaxID=109461 RepID=A0A7M7JP60_VARDE|nr:mitogen-activated protein kinase HOG1-like [Varroa destructor]XP_022654773.1 mitogen-activated protein kinase HOG1-like [Varroa destructor]XP_022688472.1 mitogen-activated protein kinase HOG1-like [Varroa jacobsoni]